MNIYLHQLRSMRKSALIWVCSLIALALLYFSVYPAVVGDAEGFRQLLGNYPPSVRAALGISLDSITSLLGFYAMVFSFITLCGAIQAMNYGLSVLSRESRERTADFLLLKPVSRPVIVSAKLLAALTVLITTDMIYCIAVLAMAETVKTADFSLKLFLMENLTLLLVQLIFLALGLVISVFFSRLKSVLSISLGVVFGFYIAGALIATEPDGAARWLSPFKYFDIPYLLANGRFETPYLIAGAGIVAVSVAVSYVVYDRKDIHAV